jgi:hypothetical protein
MKTISSALHIRIPGRPYITGRLFQTDARNFASERSMRLRASVWSVARTIGQGKLGRLRIMQMRDAD